MGAFPRLWVLGVSLSTFEGSQRGLTSNVGLTAGLVFPSFLQILSCVQLSDGVDGKSRQEYAEGLSYV